jgi:hypothetical protein
VDAGVTDTPGEQYRQYVMRHGATWLMVVGAITDRLADYTRLIRQ